LYLHLHKALKEDGSEAEARAGALRDWVLDAQLSATASTEELRDDANLFTREKVFDAMFSLADTWTIGTSAEEFVAFLDALRSSISDDVVRCDASPMLKPLRAITSRDLGLDSSLRAPVGIWLVQARERAAAKAAARNAAQLASELEKEFVDDDVDKLIAAIEAGKPKPKPPASGPSSDIERAVLQKRQDKQRQLARKQKERQLLQQQTLQRRPTQPPLSAEEVIADAERRKKLAIKAATKANLAAAFAQVPASTTEIEAAGDWSPQTNLNMSVETPRKASIPLWYPSAASPLSSARRRAPSSSSWRGNASSWESDTAAWSVLARTEQQTTGMCLNSSEQVKTSPSYRMSSAKPATRLLAEIEPPGSPFSKPRRTVSTPSSSRPRTYLTPCHQVPAPRMCPLPNWRNTQEAVEHAWSARRASPTAVASGLRPLVISSATAGRAPARDRCDLFY
jgi:hypothetical protein